MSWIISITVVLLIGSLYSITSKYKKLRDDYEDNICKMKDLEKKDVIHEHIINSTICEIRVISRQLQEMRSNSEYPDYKIHELIDNLDKIEIIVYDRW